MRVLVVIIWTIFRLAAGAIGLLVVIAGFLEREWGYVPGGLIIMAVAYGLARSPYDYLPAKPSSKVDTPRR